MADVTDGTMIAEVVKKHHVDAIYNLAALLSVVAESKPGWHGASASTVCGTSWKWRVRTVARCSRPAASAPSA